MFIITTQLHSTKAYHRLLVNHFIKAICCHHHHLLPCETSFAKKFVLLTFVIKFYILEFILFLGYIVKHEEMDNMKRSSIRSYINNLRSRQAMLIIQRSTFFHFYVVNDLAKPVDFANTDLTMQNIIYYLQILAIDFF